MGIYACVCVWSTRVMSVRSARSTHTHSVTRDASTRKCSFCRDAGEYVSMLLPYSVNNELHRLDDKIRERQCEMRVARAGLQGQNSKYSRQRGPIPDRLGGASGGPPEARAQEARPELSSRRSDREARTPVGSDSVPITAQIRVHSLCHLVSSITAEVSLRPDRRKTTGGSGLGGVAMDPVTYLCQGRFHRSIRCSRTGSRVTFALIGKWKDDENGRDPDELAAPLPQRPRLTLFCPPSGCSRYMGILLDGVAEECGMAILTIDRPGVGSVPMTEEQSRMSTSTDQTLSVLEALGVTHLDILAHSAGWFYALNLMCTRPDLVVPPPPSPTGSHTAAAAAVASRIAFSTPFVPTNRSSATVLSLLPASVVRMAPAANDLLGELGKALTWSQAVGHTAADILPAIPSPAWLRHPQKTETERDAAKRERSRRRNPSAKFHPPYKPHAMLALDRPSPSPSSNARRRSANERPSEVGTRLLLQYFTIEGGVHAATQDFLFCLGKTRNMDNLQLEAWMRERWTELAHHWSPADYSPSSSVSSSSSHSKPALLVLWAENDFMIPKKGRDYLRALLLTTSGMGRTEDCVTFQEWVAAEAGHDDPMIAGDTMRGMLSFLQQQQQQQQEEEASG